MEVVGAKLKRRATKGETALHFHKKWKKVSIFTSKEEMEKGSTGGRNCLRSRKIREQTRKMENF